MKIEDIFEKNIRRKIEEVVKVDQHDPETVKGEIEEYVTTPAIVKHFKTIYGSIAEYPSAPHEGIGVWVSGFFGSGKSLFAKILGYSLANRKIMNSSASKLFVNRVKDSDIEGLLVNINFRFPYELIIFDVSMDRDVRYGDEKLTWVMYRKLLQKLGYSTDPDLAKLEMELEKKGKLDEFKNLFKENQKASWEDEREMGSAINQASLILHKLQPSIFPTQDSYLNSFRKDGDTGETIGREVVSPNILATQTFELVSRRASGKGIVFIIDEVGQYVGASVDKMLDLAGIIQAFGRESKNRFISKKTLSPCWVVVTSQEKLNEVVAAIDSTKIELARLQDRFPIALDLKPSDIQEVTKVRVLAKKGAGERILAELFDNNDGRLKTHCKLERTTRDTKILKTDFIALYPYLPYQIDLSIDIVSGLRLKRDAQRHIGGSNRTIIKQAQQLLIHPITNLAEKDVGTLVTLDLIYDLLSEGNLLPSEVSREIDDVKKKCKDSPLALKVAKTIALLENVKDLPRTAKNLSVTLHPSITSESMEKDIECALNVLEGAQVIRLSEEGYKLLSGEEKNWESERMAMSPKPKDRNELKKGIIKDLCGNLKLSVIQYKSLKTFKLSISVDREKIEEGILNLSLHIADEIKKVEELQKDCRTESREKNHAKDFYWVFSLTEETHGLIEELYRSKGMISHYGRLRANHEITSQESACLEEEKTRENQIAQGLRAKVSEAMRCGSGFFQGVEVKGEELGKTVAESIKSFVLDKILVIYPKLEIGARNLKGDEPERLLKTQNLKGLSEIFYGGESGLNLVIERGGKYVPNPSAPVAQEVRDHITREFKYGNSINGKTLKKHFQEEVGWDCDIVRLGLAVLFRASIIEVTYQGIKYKNYSDPNAIIPITNIVAFNSSTFVPRQQMTSEMLTKAAQKFEELSGIDVQVEENAIVTKMGDFVSADKELAKNILGLIQHYNLPGEEVSTDLLQLIEQIQKGGSEDCINLLAGQGQTYKELREKLLGMEIFLTKENLESIQTSRRIVEEIGPVLNTRWASEEIQEKMNHLGELLQADELYEGLTKIKDATQSIFAAYKTYYNELHNLRRKGSTEIISKVKGHKHFQLLQLKDKENVLGDLNRNCCKGKITEFQAVCKDCRSTLAELRISIQALKSLREDSISEIERLTMSHENFKVVCVSDLISGYIETEDDLIKAVDKLKKHLTKLLSEGCRISIR